ncbi:hypothetical protein [Frigoriflavimonas asaccharolytica]|uniref:Uncharacterized protein n=1 Tax=Frigoriflavimonas asaccharolytica TaxID=2735899 RepID=A0A8J8G7X3_9FLAO|nr:hypothetical protein [Frigoriflavimonas asaccharolytica]NRS92315.1 hypothetical protein [Frigoriflavimonas asaccharolytica]
MEDEIISIKKEWIAKDIKSYSTHPLYSVQVNKSKCRVVIRCNDLPHWLPLTENADESMTLFLNDYIPKSGEQVLTVEIYPYEGVQYLPADAVADIRLQFAEDKMTTPITEIEHLQEQSLPENIGDKKLNFYEMKFLFKAKVPFDFSNDLNSAQDLKNVSDIEKKVVAKYNDLKTMMETGKGIEFVKNFKHNFKSSSYLYSSKTELLSTLNKEDDNDLILFCTKIGEFRKVPDFQNYEIMYGFGGKVVMLQNNKNKKTMFDIFVGGEFEDPFWYTIYLYMPSGSNELQIW